MSQPIFQGTVIRNEPAFRSRPKNLSGFHVFSHDSYDAFVANTALDHIVQEARRSAPNETIGYLVGRPFRDDRGSYAIITDALTATSAKCGPATVQTTLDDERRLVQIVQNEYPLADKMGWYHSHPFDMPHYSNTDAANQRFWNEPSHLGLLAVIDHDHDSVRVHAFHGPQSEPAGPPFVVGQHEHLPVFRALREEGTKGPDRRTATERVSVSCGAQIPEFGERRQPVHRDQAALPKMAITALLVAIIWPVVFFNLFIQRKPDGSRPASTSIVPSVLERSNGIAKPKSKAESLGDENAIDKTNKVKPEGTLPASTSIVPSVIERSSGIAKPESLGDENPIDETNKVKQAGQVGEAPPR